MKKQLLFSALCLVGVSAFALKDITPEKYNFNKATSFEYHHAVFGTSNIGAPVWTTIDGAANYDNGLAVLCGGVAYWGAGNTSPREIDETKGGPILKAGTSLVDLGGEVGQVLCINGFKSNINSRIEELYGVNPEIPACTDALGWFNINFFCDPALLNTDGSDDYYNVRCRITCNFYENNITDGNSLVNPFLVGNQGNLPDTYDNAITTDNFVKMNADQEPVDDDGEPSDDYYWDPTRWMVYEVNMKVMESDDNGDYAPVRLKYDIKADPLSNGTMFIKSIEFFVPTQSEAVNTGKPQISFVTLTPDPAHAGVNAPVADAAAAAPVYYNMQGMRVANPQNGLYIVVRGNEVSKEIIR